MIIILKLAIKSSLILYLAIAFIMPVYATTFFYAFNCSSNDDNSTMWHEGSLQQSNKKDGGDRFDYHSGSFSYLEKGRISFKDIIGFQEKRNEDPRLSRYRDDSGDIFHNMNVSFEGAKGISEFYASSFFSDGSMISSKNAIRFEEFSCNLSQDWDNNLKINYSAEKIDLNVNAIMGNSRKSDFGYDFLYNATIANGIVETNRLMRLANRIETGKLSLEQASLMKGNITLADHLSASNLFGRIYAKN